MILHSKCFGNQLFRKDGMDIGELAEVREYKERGAGLFLKFS